jgi:hypothetical protein
MGCLLRIAASQKDLNSCNLVQYVTVKSTSLSRLKGVHFIYYHVTISSFAEFLQLQRRISTHHRSPILNRPNTITMAGVSSIAQLHPITLLEAFFGLSSDEAIDAHLRAVPKLPQSFPQDLS